MYHDVESVRTKDDANLTIKLMIFFTLRDIELMLNSSHDVIADVYLSLIISITITKVDQLL
jgi:hypothetical protein